MPGKSMDGNEKILNILCAADYDAEHQGVRKYVDAIKTTYETTNLFTVGSFNVVNSVEEIEQTLNKYAYDVLVCFDHLNGNAVGSGSINKWKERFPKLRVILMMVPKENSRKPALLFEKGYYDAIFLNRLKEEHGVDDLLNLALEGRSEAEASVYYGIAAESEQVTDEVMFSQQEESTYVEPARQVTDEVMFSQQEPVSEMQMQGYAPQTQPVQDYNAEAYTGGQTAPPAPAPVMSQTAVTPTANMNMVPQMSAQEVYMAQDTTKQFQNGDVMLMDAQVVYVCSHDTAIIQLADVSENLSDKKMVLIPCMSQTGPTFAKAEITFICSPYSAVIKTNQLQFMVNQVGMPVTLPYVV